MEEILSNNIANFLPKTNAEKQKEYRKRKKAKALNQTVECVSKKTKSKTTAERVRACRSKKILESLPKSKKKPKTVAEHCKDYRKRKLEETKLETAKAEPKSKKFKLEERMVYNEFPNASKKFKERVYDDEFGLACKVCDRIWFSSDLRVLKEESLKFIQLHTQLESLDKCCNTCVKAITQEKVPPLAVINGFKYQPYPDQLPNLNKVEERLISPRLPFMQIRRLRKDYGQYKIIGNIINIPVSVNNMVNALPRNINDDFSINVHMMKQLYHKSVYLLGFVKKSNLKKWLEYLCEQPLYKEFKICVDDKELSKYEEVAMSDVRSLNKLYNAEILEHLDPTENRGVAIQQTLMWDESKYLAIAPAASAKVISLLFDRYAEELSFPAIYLGNKRVFNEALNVTYFMMANSEIRRKDRRGVTPEHTLYMAMKVLRLRLAQGLSVAFHSLGTKNMRVTKKELFSEGFISKCLDKNLAFLKTILNSAAYWKQRKNDVFAMLRQLGKPTIFLTMSACEHKWPFLIKTLYKIKHNTVLSDKDLEKLDKSEVAELINNDPVTCAAYFNRIVDTIMGILKDKKNSPFGKNYVVDYFKRIEFQHRGSPHAHILLWLNEAPQDALEKDQEKAIELINRISSTCSEFGLSDRQQHSHSFTCWKHSVLLKRFADLERRSILCLKLKF